MDLTKKLKPKLPDIKPIGYKCSSDGKFYVGFKEKKCRYCNPVYNINEWNELEKR